MSRGLNPQACASARSHRRPEDAEKPSTTRGTKASARSFCDFTDSRPRVSARRQGLRPELPFQSDSSKSRRDVVRRTGVRLLKGVASLLEGVPGRRRRTLQGPLYPAGGRGEVRAAMTRSEERRTSRSIGALTRSGSALGRVDGSLPDDSRDWENRPHGAG